MYIWEIIAWFVVMGVVAHRAALVFFRARAARIQMSEGHPYEKLSTDYTKTLLVLGDSTGVGIGATSPEESIAGRLAAYIGATHVENYAVSGADVASLPSQIEKATLNNYDVILIQIGGHDIMLFHDAARVAKRLDSILSTLPDAGKVILMSVGNMGGASIFPYLVRPFHTWTTHAYHRWFSKVAKHRRALYVNLYLKPEEDLFIQNRDLYFSPDGLHPSSEGYALWFSKLKEALRKEPSRENT